MHNGVSRPMSSSNKYEFNLARKGDQVFLHFMGDEAEIPVRILLVAPLSDKQRTVSIMHQTEKRELVLLFTLDDLQNEDRKIIQHEIKRRYFFPKIQAINDINIQLGDYYWDVVTDRGPRKFLLNSPAMNIRWLSDQRLLLSDSESIKYEIEDIQALDQASRDWVDRIL